jgi:hypothetical protein
VTRTHRPSRALECGAAGGYRLVFGVDMDTRARTKNKNIGGVSEAHEIQYIPGSAKDQQAQDRVSGGATPQDTKGSHARRMRLQIALLPPHLASAEKALKHTGQGRGLGSACGLGQGPLRGLGLQQLTEPTPARVRAEARKRLKLGHLGGVRPPRHILCIL